jgi:hypothetical protein
MLSRALQDPDRPDAAMPTRTLTRLLPLIAALALALAAPAALARTQRGACAGHGASRSGHAARCTHRRASPPKARHKSASHHAKHAPKPKHAPSAPHQPAFAPAASCEDDSTPRLQSGEASCTDGSAPVCENGSIPAPSVTGTLLCQAGEDSQPGGETECAAEACPFDPEEIASGEMALCESCQAPGNPSEAEG